MLTMVAWGKLFKTKKSRQKPTSLIIIIS